MSKPKTAPEPDTTTETPARAFPEPNDFDDDPKPKTITRRKPSSALQAAGQIEAILEKFDGHDIARILGWVSGSFQERLYPGTKVIEAAERLGTLPAPGRHLEAD